eukprot:g166.t1
MGAMIFVNGVFLGNTTNAYRRYVFTLDVRHDLVSAAQEGGGEHPQNELEIHFGAELGINANGRYTHSQDIDWAPTMPTYDHLSPQAAGFRPRATFGFAIWKSVYLVPLPRGMPAVTHLVPHTFYAGGHPTLPLTTDTHAGFEVRVGVELFCPSASYLREPGTDDTGDDQDCKGTVSFIGSWPNAKRVFSGPVVVKAGTHLTVNLTTSHTETTGVELWHPRGNGVQRRYNATATFRPSSTVLSSSVSSCAVLVVAATRAVGFRHVALVTRNESSIPPVAAANETHTGGFTFFFRVNGAAVFARGANKVPMDLMEGRMTAAAHRRLAQSAADGNFNMIRVWGGGLWEHDVWYDSCDRLGLLVYHDLQFDRDELPLATTADGRDEIAHQVRRLSHHPSVVAWDGGNEMYAPLQRDLDRIMSLVALHDQSRPVWPASPGSGWLSGVDPLSSRPCGASPSLQVMPTSLPAREVDAIGTGGDGSGGTLGLEGPGARATRTGVDQAGWFTSEFGCAVWQSFESMRVVFETMK